MRSAPAALILGPDFSPFPRALQIAVQRGSDRDSSPRLLYLDAARGIAAWMVALQHLLNLNAPSGRVLYFFFNGTAAVSFFFVLSGMVLSHKFISLRQTLDIRRFALTRFMRLFPGFAAAVLLHAGYAFWVGYRQEHSVSALLHQLPAVAAEICILRPHPFYFPPGWTIPFEAAASLALPLLLLLYQWTPKALWWLILMILLTGSSIFNPLFLNFIFGVLIAAYLPLIQSADFRKTAAFRWRYPALAIAALLCSVRPLGKIIPFGSLYSRSMEYLSLDYYFFAGIGAAVFLVALLRGRWLQRVLMSRVLLFFGKISFGIYLMHWVLMELLRDYCYAAIKAAFPVHALAVSATTAAYIAAITVLATAMYYGVERPAIRLGKRWAARLRPLLTLVPDSD